MTSRSRRLALAIITTCALLAAALAIAWYVVTLRYGEAAWSASTWWPRHDVADAGGFLVRPYLQLGDAPAAADPEAMTVLWHAEDVDADWSVTSRASADRPWAESAPAFRRVAIAGLPAHRVYRARLAGLIPGAPFEYRVSRRGPGPPPFAAAGLARKPAGRPQRFVAFGDCAAGTMGQRAVAYRAALERPDYVVVTGDIVYMAGKVAEYRDYFFPVYNADAAAPGLGAPLLRSVPFLAAPGNHDVVATGLDESPGALAFFHYWDQPLNGPFAEVGAPNTPPLNGPEALRRAYLDASGPAYPRMANFSFDYGDVHWTVLDGNAHVDWASPDLRRWVEEDLRAARGAPWRFVCLHQPPFSSSKAHASEQRTRLLADAFEAGGVSIVFAGHVHNYQRTHPLKFAVSRDPAGLPILGRPVERVDGAFTLDTAFDGVSKTVPDGVIYVITGAGGARLYNTEQEGDPSTWQPFTRVFHSNRHSLTVVDVEAGSVSVRQVASDGRELDRFRVTRAGR